MSRPLKEGYSRGPLQGHSVVGEVTEALQRFLLDAWRDLEFPPRVEEDLSFVPKDREEVVYVYMYRCAQNQSLMNSKRWREARVQVGGEAEGTVFFERPPLYLDLYYLLAVHSKFRSDAERLLGNVLIRMHEATHLVYRPRRFILPDGREVDSTGKTYDIDASGEDLIMEKVSMAWVDDLTIGDALNFFTIHEAPYRPFLTYQARCAMDGPLVAAPSGTTVRMRHVVPQTPPGRGGERPSGRIGSGRGGDSE